MLIWPSKRPWIRLASKLKQPRLEFDFECNAILVAMSHRADCVDLFFLCPCVAAGCAPEDDLALTSLVRYLVRFYNLFVNCFARSALKETRATRSSQPILSDPTEVLFVCLCITFVICV